MEKIEALKKELFADVEHKIKDKNWKYEEDDREQVAVHRVIDCYVSYISVAETEELAEELGVKKIAELETDYLGEFGELSEKAKANPTDKLRLLLYWYLEKEYYKQKTGVGKK